MEFEDYKQDVVITEKVSTDGEVNKYKDFANRTKETFKKLRSMTLNLNIETVIVNKMMQELEEYQKQNFDLLEDYKIDKDGYEWFYSK